MDARAADEDPSSVCVWTEGEGCIDTEVPEVVFRIQPNLLACKCSRQTLGQLFSNPRLVWADWKFEDGPGTDTVTDSAPGHAHSGNTYHGNSRATFPDSKWGDSPLGGGSYALHFDRDEQAEARMPQAGLPSGDSSRTVMGWWKQLDRDEGCEHIFGYGYPDCNGRNFVVRLSSNDRLWYDSWCVDEFRDGTDGTIRDGMNGRRTQWNHVVMTYESGSNTLSAYLNGELAKRGSPDSRPDTDTSDRHFFYVGQNQVWCTAKQR